MNKSFQHKYEYNFDDEQSYKDAIESAKERIRESGYSEWYIIDAPQERAIYLETKAGTEISLMKMYSGLKLN